MGEGGGDGLGEATGGGDGTGGGDTCMPSLGGDGGLAGTRQLTMPSSSSHEVPTCKLAPLGPEIVALLRQALLPTEGESFSNNS